MIEYRYVWRTGDVVIETGGGKLPDMLGVKRLPGKHDQRTRAGGAEKGYDPRQPRDAAELPFQRDRAALLAAVVKAFNG